MWFWFKHSNIDSTESQWVIAGLLLLNPIKTPNALTEQGQWSVACGQPFCNLSWRLGSERGACLLRLVSGPIRTILLFYAHRSSLHGKQRPCNNKITKNYKWYSEKFPKPPSRLNSKTKRDRTVKNTACNWSKIKEWKDLRISQRAWKMYEWFAENDIWETVCLKYQLCRCQAGGICND